MADLMKPSAPVPEPPVKAKAMEAAKAETLNVAKENTGDEAFRRQLRRSLLAQRRTLSADDCAHASALICAHLREHFPQLAVCCVGFCWPMNHEPDVRAALAEWAQSAAPGFLAALPVVAEVAKPLLFRAWQPGETMFARDCHGIPYPASGALVDPDALLIPCAAVDAAGYRLGYGGGYFDRTLAARSPRPLAIGVAYAFACVDSVRPQLHDEPLDALVTEAGVTYFAS
ncbi:5-formyltetrahydrofolate cyclo-ligase [Rhodocyclus gracilis]|uniref:5-formyltetrahydrofolate cyclo-ligase n=1 Tax=Rhodocyclus gracilis TaxID=2929842 RepID=UPI001E319651|nr:5-formyltetrahydrofolate cyclo-ligase [Rhodocyclus gracilis]